MWPPWSVNPQSTDWQARDNQSPGRLFQGNSSKPPELHQNTSWKFTVTPRNAIRNTFGHWSPDALVLIAAQKATVQCFLLSQGPLTSPYHINVLIRSPTLGSIRSINHPFSVSPSIYATRSRVRRAKNGRHAAVWMRRHHGKMKPGDDVKLTVNIKDHQTNLDVRGWPRIWSFHILMPHQSQKMQF